MRQLLEIRLLLSSISVKHFQSTPMDLVLIISQFQAKTIPCVCYLKGQMWQDIISHLVEGQDLENLMSHYPQDCKYLLGSYSRISLIPFSLLCSSRIHTSKLLLIHVVGRKFSIPFNQELLLLFQAKLWLHILMSLGIGAQADSIFHNGYWQQWNNQDCFKTYELGNLKEQPIFTNG